MVKYIFSIDELFKSRVKAHPSKTKTGKLTMVREYSRKVEKANRHFSDEQIRKKVLDDRLVFAFLPRENYVINYSGMTVDDRFRYIEFMAQIKPEFKLKNYDFEYDLPKRIKKPNDIRQYFKKNNFIGDKGHKIGNVAIDLSGVTKNLNKKQVDEFIKKLPYLMIQVIGKLDGLDSGDLEKVLSVSQLEQLSDNFDLISKKDFSTRERLFSEREKLGKYSKIYEVSLAELLSGWAVSHGTDSSKIIKSISEKLFNKEHIQFYSGEKSGLKDKYKVDKDYSSRLIEHVKGFGKDMGNDMYIFSQIEYADFVDFLVHTIEIGMFSSKFEDLIKINYFEKFGNNKKLLLFYKEFTKGKFRYNKKLKNKTKQLRLVELHNIFNNIENKRLNFNNQLDAEKEILGYLQSTYPVDKHFVYVFSVDTRFSPRVETYCLNNGARASLKVRKKLYDNKIFYGGEILKIKSFKKKETVDFKDSEFIKRNDNTYDWWIEDYDIIPQKNFDEIVATMEI